MPAEEHCSVDEIMVSFKDKSSLKQFHEGGAQWLIHGTSDYERGQGHQEYCMPLTSNQAQMMENAELLLCWGLLEMLFSRLSRDLRKERTTFFQDNFFTNHAYVEGLKNKSMFFVGTYRANRLKGCKLKSEKKRSSDWSKVPATSN